MKVLSISTKDIFKYLMAFGIALKLSQLVYFDESFLWLTSDNQTPMIIVFYDFMYTIGLITMVSSPYSKSLKSLIILMILGFILLGTPIGKLYFLIETTISLAVITGVVADCFKTDRTIPTNKENIPNNKEE